MKDTLDIAAIIIVVISMFGLFIIGCFVGVRAATEQVSLTEWSCTQRTYKRVKDKFVEKTCVQWTMKKGK